MKYSTVQYNTVQYSTVQHNTEHFSTQYQESTVQHSPKHHRSVQYSSVQYSTGQLDLVCLEWLMFRYCTPMFTYDTWCLAPQHVNTKGGKTCLEKCLHSKHIFYSVERGITWILKVRKLNSPWPQHYQAAYCVRLQQRLPPWASVKTGCAPYPPLHSVWWYCLPILQLQS